MIARERTMRESEYAAPSTIRRRLAALSSLYKHLSSRRRQFAHSITSSADSTRECGTVKPRCCAVFKFITRLNLSGRSIGRSAGLAPFSTLPTMADNFELLQQAERPPPHSITPSARGGCAWPKH
jgi:hypothetical protein